MKKYRLDRLLTEKGLAQSRSKAQALIMAGKVRVNGEVVTKAGTQLAADVDIWVEQDLPYVSRGGVKLAAALDKFGLDPAGAVCADVGASTGGFTDVLLQRGAARIYAIDVGYGQLAWKLRQDERVVVMERTNARYLKDLPETINLITIDASFISLSLILPAVVRWLGSAGEVLALVKPQFEAGKSQVGKGGVVREAAVHREVLEEAVHYAHDVNLHVLGLMPSPITGPAGNHEFFLYLGRQESQPSLDVATLIEDCLAQIYPVSSS